MVGAGVSTSVEHELGSLPPCDGVKHTQTILNTCPVLLLTSTNPPHNQSHRGQTSKLMPVHGSLFKGEVTAPASGSRTVTRPEGVLHDTIPTSVQLTIVYLKHYIIKIFNFV